MSELTPCNYCTLQRYRRKYGERLPTRIADGHGQALKGWTEILVDGKPLGVHLQVVTDRCVC